MIVTFRHNENDLCRYIKFFVFLQFFDSKMIVNNLLKQDPREGYMGKDC